MKARSAKVSAVVVSYNTRELLRDCLDALSDGYETVVVDSGSTDGSAELVRAHFPNVRLISLANVGFGSAANAGIRATDSPYVLLLNADARPLESSVERLVECAENDPRVALVGPQLVTPERESQRSVIRHPLGVSSLVVSTLCPKLGSNAYTAWRRLAHRTSTVLAREFLMGAVVLIRREAVDHEGLFDESFFMFNEEIDLSFRLRQAGWRVEFCPQATFMHVAGASTSRVKAEMALERLRSHVRFVAKHESRRKAEFARRALVLVLRLRRRRAEAAWLAGQSLDELLGTTR